MYKEKEIRNIIKMFLMRNKKIRRVKYFGRLMKFFCLFFKKEGMINLVSIVDMLRGMVIGFINLKIFVDL